MDIKEIRQLVRLVENSGIDELEISRDDTNIRIQKSPSSYVAPLGMAAATPAATVPGAALPAATPAPLAEATPAAGPSQTKWKEVRSPIVGTFYRAPSPDASPFVEVGAHVSVGQTLCIVEAMKVMNEIEAEFAGTIKEVLVENAAPVEAEGVMFLIDPD